MRLRRVCRDAARRARRPDDPAAPDRALRRCLPGHRRRAADDRLRARSPQPATDPELRPELARLGTRVREPRSGRPPGVAARRACSRPSEPSCAAEALHRLLLEYLLALGVMTMVSVPPAGCWPAARCGRCARSPRPRGASRARTWASESGCAGPPTSSRSWPTPSTACWRGSTPPSPASATSWPTPRTSCARRWPSCAPRSTSRWPIPDAVPDELRAMGEAVRETIDRCERLIDGLLLLARSEAASRARGAGRHGRAGRDCITDLRGRAVHAQVRVRDDLEPAWTRGQPGLLERMIANLVENAIRHNEPGGFLEICTGVQYRPRAGRRIQWRSPDRRCGGADA